MTTVHRKTNYDIKIEYPLLFRTFGCEGNYASCTAPDTNTRLKIDGFD